jgi:hypothetical protein
MAEQAPSSCVQPFLLPRCFLIAGSSGCGKTQLVKNLILDSEHVFSPPPDRVVYVYSIFQPAYDELEKALGENIEFRTTIPSEAELKDFYNETGKSTLLVLDDKMTSLDNGTSGKNLVRLATVISHHCKVSVMFLVQNLYHNTQSAREVSLNCMVTIVFRNDRSASQISKLGTQVMPGKVPYFIQSYVLATSENYGYLVIDLSPNVDPKFKLRTHVLAGQDLKIYLPSNEAN